jgi:hypothetical protein
VHLKLKESIIQLNCLYVRSTCRQLCKCDGYMSLAVTVKYNPLVAEFGWERAVSSSVLKADDSCPSVTLGFYNNAMLLKLKLIFAIFLHIK